jgi:hypothetical protein
MIDGLADLLVFCTWLDSRLVCYEAIAHKLYRSVFVCSQTAKRDEHAHWPEKPDNWRGAYCRVPVQSGRLNQWLNRGRGMQRARRLRGHRMC